MSPGKNVAERPSLNFTPEEVELIANAMKDIYTRNDSPTELKELAYQTFYKLPGKVMPK